jgi:UDP-N-acetylmuramoylalanine--D-glutamate ligase
VVIALERGNIVRASGASALGSRGPQFAEDAAAASAAVVFAGADAQAVERGLRGFVPDAHRLEYIGELDGVTYYDDSKATNPHAAVAALRAFDRVVLIAGGRSKDLDLSGLGAEAGRVRSVVAMGEAARDVADAFEGTGVTVVFAASMDDAVRAAAAGAEAGDAVLLAPACASFDAYESYAERGRAFVEACRSLGVGM